MSTNGSRQFAAGPSAARSAPSARSCGDCCADQVSPREGGDPVWAPAFAGEQAREGDATATHYHPGEGRGPVGKVAVTRDCAQLATSPTWAPAFAGVAHCTEGRISQSGAFHGVGHFRATDEGAGNALVSRVRLSQVIRS